MNLKNWTRVVLNPRRGVRHRLRGGARLLPPGDHVCRIVAVKVKHGRVIVDLQRVGELP